MSEGDAEERWGTEPGGDEARAGLGAPQGESYKFFKLFYDVTSQRVKDESGRVYIAETANHRTIGIISAREKNALFGFEAVGQAQGILGLNFLADLYTRNHKSYFMTTVSVQGAGRADNRVIHGRSGSQPAKKRGLLGIGRNRE